MSYVITTNSDNFRVVITKDGVTEIETRQAYNAPSGSDVAAKWVFGGAPQNVIIALLAAGSRTVEMSAVSGSQQTDANGRYAVSFAQAIWP